MKECHELITNWRTERQETTRKVDDIINFDMADRDSKEGKAEAAMAAAKKEKPSRQRRSESRKSLMARLPLPLPRETASAVGVMNKHDCNVLSLSEEDTPLSALSKYAAYIAGGEVDSSVTWPRPPMKAEEKKRGGGNSTVNARPHDQGVEYRIGQLVEIS